MNHANNKDNSNNKIGHRRILKPEIPEMNSWQIVGSSNGLVCIIPTPVDAQEFYVANHSTREVVIGVGFVLGEIFQPDDSRYACDYTDISKKLRIVEGCLCIFSVDDLPNKTWVMKNYNVSSSWKVMLPCSYIHPMYDIAYKPIFNIQPNNIFYNKENICLSKTTDYMGAPIFVESLVSPHVNGRPKQVRNKKNFMPLRRG
ncbi:hypothetical protein Tco_0355566 [Tanacetum coccineum]